VALEASGAYGHVLFLTLCEAGFATDCCRRCSSPTKRPKPVEATVEQT